MEQSDVLRIIAALNKHATDKLEEFESSNNDMKLNR